MKTGIFLGLGSNLGDREQNLMNAVNLLPVRVLTRSSLYETEPLEYTDQPWFLNQVVKITTHLLPLDLLSACMGVEKALGRKREVPKGPRSIDIDILLYNHDLVWLPMLTIPHLAMEYRRFVLEPLSEIAPEFVHPRLGKSIQDILRDCSDTSVVRKI